jgi:hypothetical protein
MGYGGAILIPRSPHGDEIVPFTLKMYTWKNKPKLVFTKKLKAD